MRSSIYRRKSDNQPKPAPEQKIQQYPNSNIRQFSNLKRVTQDKCCLIIFLFYSLALVIMMGMGFFYGNFNDLGKFVNDNGLINRNQFVNQNFTQCTDDCSSNLTFLGHICIQSDITQYNPKFSKQVKNTIIMYDIKSTFPMMIYVSLSLLILTIILFIIVIYVSKIIYLFIFMLFFMLLGMAFYLLKNVQNRIDQYHISSDSIFYGYQQSTRTISFVLLGLYLLIFPFILFSPKKVKLGIYLIDKLGQFYKTMSKIITITILIVVIVWCTLILQIFLIMNFYSDGSISKIPQYSMFHTYQNIHLSHPAALTFYFIGIFWVYSTMLSWHRYFVSCAMCMWYFQQSQSLHTIKRVIKRSLHHVGSAAIDGILFPLEWVLLLIYSIVKTNKAEQQQQQQQQKQSALFITHYIDTIRNYFIRCYRCINRDGANSAALTNYGYFQSCQNANEILSMKLHEFFNIGGTITLFFTLFVAILWMAIMYFILYFGVYNKGFPPVISSISLSVFLVFVIGIVIGCLLSNIFIASVDCLIYCYLFERKCLAEGSQMERNEEELKIKKVLDQCYCMISENQQNSVFVYEQLEENTFDISYVTKKQ